MLSRLKSVLTDMTWYLRSGVAPVRANSSSVKNLKDLNHMASRKFAMTMVAVSIIAFMYFASVLLLFLLPGDPQVTALVNMYKDMIVAVASIVATLVGIQGLVDWKHNSDTKTTNTNETITQNQYTEEYLSGPKEDDYQLEVKMYK